jgi:hypothetical protein
MIHQYWRLTHPDGAVSAVDIETGENTALKMYELAKAHGCTVLAISFGDYLALCDQLEDAADHPLTP